MIDIFPTWKGGSFQMLWNVLII